MKKLSTAFYIIRNAKTYMSASSLILIYYAFFNSAMSHGIIFYFGGTCRIVPQFLACKKGQVELWKDVGIDFNVQIYLRNYKFCL